MKKDKRSLKLKSFSILGDVSADFQSRICYVDRHPSRWPSTLFEPPQQDTAFRQIDYGNRSILQSTYPWPSLILRSCQRSGELVA